MEREKIVAQVQSYMYYHPTRFHLILFIVLYSYQTYAMFNDNTCRLLATIDVVVFLKVLFSLNIFSFKLRNYDFFLERSLIQYGGFDDTVMHAYCLFVVMNDS